MLRSLRLRSSSLSKAAAAATVAGLGAFSVNTVASCEPSLDSVVSRLEKVANRLEAIAESGDYDTTVDAALLAKYSNSTDGYIASCISKICAAKVTNPSNLTASLFSIKYFDSLSEAAQKGLAMCINSGAQNADSGMGCYAMSPTDYDTYGPFFSRVIAAYHKVPRGSKHVTDWNLSGVEGLPEDGQLDLTKLGLPALSMRVRVGRNLSDFKLPGAMTAADRLRMEQKMCVAFEKLKQKFGGRYHSLTPGHPDHINNDEYNALVKGHKMFKDMSDDSYLADAGIASDWPVGRGCYPNPNPNPNPIPIPIPIPNPNQVGRGCYVSGDGGFIIWVGEEDHLRIMCMNKGTVLNEVFDRLKMALDTVESIEGLKFAHSDTYGYVTSCPTNLGTGMRASVHMKCPNLTADGTDAACKAVCKPLGLSVRGLGGEHTPIGADGTVDISPSARFCISEAQIVTALYTGIKNLVAEEAKAKK